jgi:hypothetical protein
VPLTTPTGPRVPNELGRIPIVEWHQVVTVDGTYKVSRERFRAELRELHARGYVPVNLSELLDKTMDVPAGKSPVLLTFDDASPSQFRYLERNGRLVVDPTSAVGMLLDFVAAHPDWKAKGLFCLMPAAEAGHAFFGDKGIDGQQTAWRFKKVQFLVQQGFELCNHTLWHAKLSKYSDAVVQEQLARGARVGAPLRIVAEEPGARDSGLVVRREGQAHRTLPARCRARSIWWSSAQSVRSGVQSDVVAAGAAAGRHLAVHNSRPDGQTRRVGALRLRRQSEDRREAVARAGG